MKLAALAFVVLLTAPALAQTPSSAPRDPFRDEMAAIARTCSDANPAKSLADIPAPPEQYEAAAALCEAALIQLDTALASIPEPTGRQRSDHAQQTFFLHTRIGSYYRQADFALRRQGGARADPMIPGPRACRAYEHVLEAYGRIDPGRRRSGVMDHSIWSLARDLTSCRDRYDAPDGAAAIPAVASPVPPTPPLGTLRGDFDAVVTPCLSLAMDQDVPLVERTRICERASEIVPAVMAIYPDATDAHRPSVELQLVQLYTFLAILQSNIDGRATPRACASLEKAVAADALVEERAGFRHPVSPMIDVLLETRLALCRVVGPSQ